MERFLLFSLFPSLSQLILAWNDSIMVFFLIFSIFFAFFFEFSITGLVGTQRNDFIFFYFLSSSAFPDLYWLEMLSKWWFLIFWFVLLFFGIFYYELGRNSSERFFLFSLFLGLSQLILGGKVSKMVVFNFFCYFLEFFITTWVGTHRNDFFLFFFSPLFLGLPQLILAWKDATMVFSNFFEFFAIFFEFSITGRVGTHWNDFFFLSYSAFPNLFSLFLGLPQHILPRKAAIIVFFNFFC